MELHVRISESITPVYVLMDGVVYSVQHLLIVLLLIHVCMVGHAVIMDLLCSVIVCQDGKEVSVMWVSTLVIVLLLIQSMYAWWDMS